MTGNRLALDTNVAIAVLNAADVARWLDNVESISLPVPVVGELRFGALNSRRHAENLSKVDALVQRCQVVNSDVVTAAVYAEIRMNLKRAGKPIPENDIWVAALCIQHDLPLATTDKHFDAIDSLRLWRH